jgi:hypothetical protein
MNIPPGITYSGNKDRAISLKSKAIVFYHFIVNQANLGGTLNVMRSERQPDGSEIRVTAYHERNYDNWYGHIDIIGAYIPKLRKKGRLLLWSDFNTPFWSQGLRVETLMGPDGLVDSFVYQGTPQPPGYSLVSIACRDAKASRFLFLPSDDLNTNPQNYTFSVNGFDLNYFNWYGKPYPAQWAIDSAVVGNIGFYFYPDYPYYWAHKDSNGKDLPGGPYVEGYFILGYSGLMNDAPIVDPYFQPYYTSNKVTIKAFKRDPVSGKKGEFLGAMIHETTSSNHAHYNQSTVTVTLDDMGFWDVYMPSLDIARITIK